MQSRHLQVAVTAVAGILLSCVPPAIERKPPVRAPDRGVTARATVPPISGRVELAALGQARSARATLPDVANGATVSLIDIGSAGTLATDLTAADGVFKLSFGAAFAPATGAIFYLEAVKGLGGHTVGKPAARVRTLIRWTGTAWQAITATEVTVGTGTTALCVIYTLKQALAANRQVGADALIGSVSGGTFSAVANASVAEYDQVRALVGAALAADRDPIANLAHNAVTGHFYRRADARLAPDDAGDPDRTHDYVMTRGGVGSTFVWIPVFTAYQLIVPGNCGAEHASRPVGYWVATEPTSGSKDVDWAEERFGGFYAARYHASRSDAAPGNPVTGAGATAGSAGTLKVARYCVPWTDITWDAAALACAAYDAHAHLLRDEEWTAMAVWATINGVSVRGNNAQTNQATAYTVLSDVDSPDITFVDDPTFAWCASGKDRALTGSATSSLWSGDTNLTAHTGTTAGVFDLNGNVWDWTETVGMAQTTGNYILNDFTVPVAAPGPGYVTSLATDPRLRRHGLPRTTSGTGASFFGNDYFLISTSGNRKLLRGGDWPMPVSGIWTVNFQNPRSDTIAHIGFRPALAF